MGFSVAVYTIFIFPSPIMLLGQYIFPVLLPATVHINIWHNKDERKREKKKRK
jgi:cytochrome bd-type quinol oxidase subunit 2